MDKDNNKIGNTIPLYDDVKRTIYINFNEMSYAYSEMITATNKNNYRLALWDFQKRFIKFFVQINHSNKLNKLTKEEKDYLISAYKHSNKLNINKARKIVDISRKLIEVLGITKIEGKVMDNWAF